MDSTTTQPPAQPGEHRKEAKDHTNLMGAVVLIVLGSLFLLNNLIPEFNFGDYWPVILIAIGLIMLFRGRRSS